MSTNQNQKDIGVLLVEVTQIVADVFFLLLKVFYSILFSIITLAIPKKRKSVKGEIVLVTGAGHGIGRELALLYASEGATVVVWDINEVTGGKTVKDIAKLGYPKAYFYKCNVGDREDVLAVGKKLQKDVGDVTILINNAGIMPTHPLLDHTKEEIERIMNINVLAHFWTLEAFLPIMKQHNYGHIVCLSSQAGMFGLPNLVPYCASKFAVRGLMEALRQELRTDRKCDIKLTCIYPYMVDTGLCKKPVIRFKNLMPMLNPKDVAEAIMNAQRKNITDLTIPSHMWTVDKYLRLLPRDAQQQLSDFLGVVLESDL